MKLSIKPALQLNSSEVTQIMQLFNADLNFESEQKREAFEDRWMGPYLQDLPSETLFFLAKDDDDVVQGYLLLAQDSKLFLEAFSNRAKSYQVFSDLFEEYPAHLHINLTPNCRGQGVGSKLMKSLIVHLTEQKVEGVHLVTSPDARNVSFYRSNGFLVEEQRPLRSTPLLFMGQKITR